MKIPHRYRILIIPLAFLLLTASKHTLALERILSFHSDIHVEENGTLRVSEHIRVVAEGKQIRRGIYRDFPTTYTDAYGNKINVKFQVEEVTRDGRQESWHKKRQANGVRVYAGKPDVTLKPGEYDYTFVYRTNRQIGFFENYDELYWNVTGNGWDFPIERASATVSLPSGVSRAAISMSAYTGPQGSTVNDSNSKIGDSSGTIETRSTLKPREGLTLIMSWPKGVVQPPSGWQKLKDLLADNLGLLLSSIAFCGSGIYLFTMWWRHGRDPGKGVIFPHYRPPAGYSPAAARYVSRMGYDKDTFTAAVINLAVKGHVSITCDDDEYSLKRESSEASLAAGEEALVEQLFRSGPVLKLENSNHTQVAAAKSAHKEALKRDYRNQYFRTNTKLLLPSIAISIVPFALMVAWGLFVPLVAALFAAVVVNHILFAYLLKAPSGRGRRLMDKLEGFKQYLTVAEKDDMNRRHPPDMTPKLFEKYLPFAIALGVEQEWSQQFSEIFAGIEAQQGSSYSPAWYHGSFNAANMDTFASAVGSNLSSAISSASTAPGSSSGSGGGGFSGGGGGGGGGGGW